MSGAIKYALGGIGVTIGQAAAVELPARIFRVRLTGMLFDTDRAFLLPSAMHGVRRVKHFYDQHPGLEVLVVGHTDLRADDEYNRVLSEERAAAVAAFLRDQVARWLQFYEAPGNRRWGVREDQHMLAHLTDGTSAFYGGPINGASTPATQAAVRKFQEWSNQTRGTNLAFTGTGPLTRRELVTVYMQEDETTLPDGTRLLSHGCGEQHPEIAEPGDVPENRRVEVFLFEGPIDPAPVERCPVGGCAEQPIWVRRTVETVDFTHDLGDLAVSVKDGTGTAIAGAVVELSGPATASASTDAAGRADFHNLGPGTYQVRVVKEGLGHAPATATIRAGRPTTVAIVAFTVTRAVWTTASARCGDAAQLAVDVSGLPPTSPATIEVLHPTTGAVFQTVNATLTGGRIAAAWNCHSATAAWRTDQMRFRVQIPSLGLTAPSSNAFTFQARPTAATVTRRVILPQPAAPRFADFGEHYDIALEAARLHLTVKYRLHGSPFPPARQTTTKALIERIWNDGWGARRFHRTACRRGNACDCAFDCCKASWRLDVSFVASGEHIAVQVIAGAPGAHSGTGIDTAEWADPPIHAVTSYAHETGHALGQYDEYATGVVDPTGTQPNPSPVDNLMKTPGDETLLNRHFRWALTFLNANSGGDSYGIIPP